MIATFILIVFLFILRYLKNSGIKILRNEEKHGIFVFLLSKILFWFVIIQLIIIWFPQALVYALPVILLLFLINMFIERHFFSEVVKSKKKRKKIN